MLSFTVATEGDKDASQAIVISVTFSDMFPFSVHHPASWRAWQTWKSLNLLKLCICVKIPQYYNNMQLRVFKSESAMPLKEQLTTLSSNIPLNLINGMEKLRKKTVWQHKILISPIQAWKFNIQQSRIPFLVQPMQHDRKRQEVTEACYTIKVGQHWCKPHVTEPHPWRSCHSVAASGWKITLTSNLVEIQECSNEARKFTLHHKHQK